MTIQYHDLPNGDRRATDDGREIGTVIAARPEALTGLQSWSTHKCDVIIFSVYQDDAHAYHNAANHRAVADKLKAYGVPFDSAHGAYNGKREQCFIINCRDSGETVARTIAAKYDQESVLYITSGRLCYLETCDGGEIIAELGKLKAVSKRVAERARAYTFANDTYYVTEK